MSEPVRVSLTIQAPVGRVMELVADLEDTDRWANEARSADVVARDDDGRPSTIVVTLGAIGFSTTAAYDVAYTDTTVTLTCTKAALIKESTIVYEAHDQGDGSTELTISTTMAVTVPVPQWGLERAMRRSSEKNLESVRKDAESAGQDGRRS